MSRFESHSWFHDEVGAASSAPLRQEAGMTVLRWILIRLPARGMILAVRGYQIFLGPLLGGHCRFQPTCSNYFIQAVEKHGPWRGAWRGVLRICRCHPFHPGGFDPP